MRDYPPGNVIVGGGGQPAYLGCAHRACKKKVQTTALGHDCCGHSKHNTTHLYDARPEPEPAASIGDMLVQIAKGLLGRR